jgi:hypothetical protein
MARAVGADEYVSPHVGGSPVGLVVIGRPAVVVGRCGHVIASIQKASRGCTARSCSRSNCARSARRTRDQAARRMDRLGALCRARER